MTDRGGRRGADVDGPVVQWLLAGDPAVRWQAQRDLLDEEPPVWTATRTQVATEGWGWRLLEAQDAAGTWGGGLYTPKWTSTTYTLLLLRRLGLPGTDERAVRGCRQLLDGAQWVDGGVSYWSSRRLAERCVNGMVLSVLSHFAVTDERVGSIARLLLSAQLRDGGWNCLDHRGASHSSFHTTISVLEGLVAWQRAHATHAADAAIARGHEFLLGHRLYRSHRTGDVINDAWTTFHFPPRWHYDILRGLDHLQDAGAIQDPRGADAMAVVAARRRADGRWPKGSQYQGRTFFVLEPDRGPGRWNTLRALRVMRWWDGGGPTT